MIQQDSILFSLDSTKVMRLDTVPKLDAHQILNFITNIPQKSFAKLDFTSNTDTISRIDTSAVDSISKIDSLSLSDTLKAVVQIPSGFVGIPHSIFPQNASWVFVVLLLLFIMFILSATSSSGMSAETMKTFFQVKERSSIFKKTTISDFRYQFFLFSFSISVFSLYAYFALNQPNEEFILKEFGIFLLITTLFFGIKSLLFDLMGFVFLEKKNLTMAKSSYFNVLSFLGIGLFPLLIIDIYSPYKITGFIGVFSIIICVMACILIIIKLFQIFLHKIVASFYILLYLCTLEFLPFFILYKVYQLVV
ncbi:MAG: DUF4271 domain-containing protein [Paludibacter sp.]